MDHVNKFIDLRKPLLGSILDFLPAKLCALLNKHIKNKKIFTLTCKTRHKQMKLGKISSHVLNRKFEMDFGIIQCVQLKSFDKNLLAVGGLSGGLELLNIINGERTVIKQHTDTINSIVDYIYNGQNLLVTSSYDNTIRFYDLKLKKNTSRVIPCEFIVYFMKYVTLEEKDYLLTTTFQEYNIRCLETMESLFSVNLHGNYIYKIIYVKQLDPELFLSCSYDNYIKLSNYRTKNVVSEINAHSSAVWGLAYLKKYNKEFCASGSWDYSIKVWNFVSGQCLATFQTSPANVKHIHQFKFLKDHIFVASSSGKLMFYNLKTMDLIYTMEEHSTDIYWFINIKGIDNESYYLVSSSIDRKINFHVLE